MPVSASPANTCNKISLLNVSLKVNIKEKNHFMTAMQKQKVANTSANFHKKIEMARGDTRKKPTVENLVSASLLRCHCFHI